ncbi:mitochondrial 54S ribosomal protein uL22m [Lodderomyces beijingensis]|uniref:Ribosomal protein L22 n=1 Tax=Lodderomyces beijingensis TaxID=1775926 RepID=A0ABP0ZT92_9ASCO
MNRWSFLARPVLQSSSRSHISYRQLAISRISHASNPFGKLTSLKQKDTTAATTTQTQTQTKAVEGGEDTIVKNEDGEVDIKSITPRNDVQLREYHAEKAAKVREANSLESMIHPLKLALFNKVVAEHGFFKNDQIVQHEGRALRFHLTPEEIEVLEPSIFLHSYRIKSSMKKATVVNRFVRGMELKTAITQLHFNPKKMATELEKLLKNGLEQARQQEYDVDRVYIARLWTGSDGDWKKRADIKGRGRCGIIQHRYVHLKCVLKTQQTKLRIAWEKAEKEKARKPKMYLNNEPLNIKVRGWYKW